MRRAPSVHLPARERRRLVGIAEASRTPARLRRRIEIVLRAADEVRNQEIARELGTDPGTVARWRKRFLLHGTAGILWDAPRPGRPPMVPDAKVGLIIRSAATAGSSPAWSTRRLAREVGVSKSTIQRIWQSRGISPYRGPRPVPREGGMRFLENVTDLVGVYLNPPERAVAFSTDETIGSGGLRPRNSQPLEQLRRRQRGIEFRAFLQIVDRETPALLDVHLLLDHRVAPVSPELDRWLRQHPRVHLHYLPLDRTGSTLIDRLVADISRGRPRSGESGSAQRLRHAVREHYRSHPGPAAPFVWTTTSEEIHRSVRRTGHTLSN